MFKVKYVDSIFRLDLNLIVSLFQHKCEVSETVSTTTLFYITRKDNGNFHSAWPRLLSMSLYMRCSLPRQPCMYTNILEFPMACLDALRPAVKKKIACLYGMRRELVKHEILM